MIRPNPNFYLFSSHKSKRSERPDQNDGTEAGSQPKNKRGRVLRDSSSDTQNKKKASRRTITISESSESDSQTSDSDHHKRKKKKNTKRWPFFMFFLFSPILFPKKKKLAPNITVRPDIRQCRIFHSAGYPARLSGRFLNFCRIIRPDIRPDLAGTGYPASGKKFQIRPNPTKYTKQK